MNKKTVITYGSFDILHVGHIRLLKRLKALGDKLIVAVSTDEFNKLKGKTSLLTYEDRKEVLEACSLVDLVIPEESWDQKVSDIQKYNVDVFGIGDDWQGKFDFLKDHCEVVYLPRTQGISSTAIKSLASGFSQSNLNELKNAVDTISTILSNFDGLQK